MSIAAVMSLVVTATAAGGDAGAASVRAAVGAVAPVRAAVHRWTAPPDLEALAARLNDDATVQLGRRAGWTVLSATEIALMVAHHKDRHDVLACEADEACLAQLAALADADKMLTGRLDRLGGGLLLTLGWSDAPLAGRGQGEAVFAESERELVAQLPGALDRLVGGPGPARTATASVPLGSRVAVIELAPYDARAELAESLAPLLALELKRLGFDVISRDEIRTLLHYETERQVLARTSDPAALAEMGGALGVEYLVAGGVGRLGDRHVIHLKLMEVAGARVTARVAETFQGPELVVAQALRFAAATLVGAPVSGHGVLEVVAHAEGVAEIDREARGLLPARFEALPAGRHRLWVGADGYLELEHDVYVEAGGTVLVRPALIAIETRWYERWWVWGAIGAAAVAGGVAIVAASTGSTPPGSAIPELVVLGR